jgi:acetylornithine deacetylase/succinyl-diaminopimelate desuccinylase-like protein
MIIPASASARLDRLVKAIDPTHPNVSACASRGLHRRAWFDGDTSGATWIARVTRSGGYAAGRTAMNVPIAATISKALADAAGGPIVRLPTIGGSAPFYVFTDVLKVPTFGLSIVNFDNNQHGPNENLRIQNLWEGIESMAALLTMP